ncbi:OmpA family protein [Donghicola sp. XS_ASV15]|uniref:OmpA family protein n=1 Tax=Donghicola sp. XS_ASV15 TaxID=3241295 RepID=UPI0035123DC6
MTKIITRTVSAVVAACTVVVAGAAFAQQGFVTNETYGVQSVRQGATVTVQGERYTPTIWIDPDGCEHWVMDDGAEGYMTPHVRRDGTPVCHERNLCGVLNTDQYFATDSYKISSAGRQSLMQFFQGADARAYIVAGHTDSRASDEYNMKLSLNRANAVAAVGNSVGAPVIDIRGYGERMPKASNATVEGMAQNRRVEIFCIR